MCVSFVDLLATIWELFKFFYRREVCEASKESGHAISNHKKINSALASRQRLFQDYKASEDEENFGYIYYGVDHGQASPTEVRGVQPQDLFQRLLPKRWPIDF
jgi:hypothetical protein